MSQHLFSFHTANIAVVGDSALDTYWYSSTNRISPEAPVPVAHYQNSEDRLSGAALVAALIKNLRGTVSLTSFVGHTCTELNQKISRLLDSYGVDSSASLIPTDFPTNNNIRIVSQAQQLLKVLTSQPTSVDEQSNQKVIPSFNFNAKHSDCNTAVFYDSANGAFSTVNLTGYIQQCHQQQIQSLYVPTNQQAIVNFINNSQLVDFIIVEQMTAAHHLPKLIDLCHRGVIVFDSVQGIKYLTKKDQPVAIQKTNNQIANNIGIYEVVAALFALSLSLNNDLNASLELVTAAMTLATKEFGQILIDIVDLQLAYADRLLNHKYNYLKLSQEIKSAVAKGQTIVFANGCFDVLHVGHVAYLDAASKRGDKLFVAINSDCSITRLKGPTRPINNLADRIALLHSLSMVDWVVPFFTDTPEDFLRWLKPDFLIKGGDYNIDQVVGREIVYSYGGQVEVIKHPFTEISSTKILEKLQ